MLEMVLISQKRRHVIAGALRSIFSEMRAAHFAKRADNGMRHCEEANFGFVTLFWMARHSEQNCELICN